MLTLRRFASASISRHRSPPKRTTVVCISGTDARYHLCYRTGTDIATGSGAEGNPTEAYRLDFLTQMVDLGIFQVPVWVIGLFLISLLTGGGFFAVWEE